MVRSPQHKADAQPQSTRSFKQNIVENYDALKAFVARYAKRPHDVEDIVQETFVRTYQAQKRHSIQNIKAYLFTTARNLSFKQAALHANKVTDYLADLGLSEVVSESASLEDEVQAHQQFSIFCEAVRELPLQCRRVFILKKIYGFSHEEIAQRLGISVSTTNQHLAKGVASCTIYMRDKGYLTQQQTLKRGGKSQQ